MAPAVIPVRSLRAAPRRRPAREAASLPPDDSSARARFATRAIELGVTAMLADDLLRLRTARGWVLPPPLQDETAVARMWDTPPA